MSRERERVAKVRVEKVGKGCKWRKNEKRELRRGASREECEWRKRE